MTLTCTRGLKVISRSPFKPLLLHVKLFSHTHISSGSSSSGGGGGSGGGSGQWSTKAGLLSGELVCVHTVCVCMCVCVSTSCTCTPPQIVRGPGPSRGKAVSLTPSTPMQAENQTAAHALLKAPAGRKSIPLS